jgi:WD40 repeat protein/tetratricopeptide (TPR) repeat protein
MNESQIFGHALKLATPAEQAAYLDQACGGDASLRAAVEALLRAHLGDPDFLEAPAAAIEPTVNVPPPAAGSPASAVPERGGVAQAGVVLGGRYKLLEAFGEGGMGAVWMAQQQEPVKRLVAVKLIKPGMDSKQVLGRFEAERQALALMDHPHIAKVLDGGAAPDGRPYFVMELVKGVPITSFCDEHRLTPRQRLELFVPVCHAVQHAHQKGVIHRDLKPSNVLVALYDDKPVPKIIDFGVAKATGQRLTEQTLHTGFGAIVGTLEYMSPEQATFYQLDIDTRSDIYALGVLLYELLAGSPPFSSRELGQAGMLEMLRVIREQEPTKPSKKLSTAQGLPTLAANRGTEPAKLTRLLHGDLDWIVMKALEKDRGRRYETANGFAMDIQRYLADEPVLACPPSAGYRLRKFAWRNKGPVLAASLVALALIGGVIGTTRGMFRATDAEVAAKREAGEKTAALGEKDKALATAKANEREAHKHETLARRRFHAAQTNLALQAWEAGQPARTLELLETLRPKFDQEDLRGFEWYYLWRLCHRNLHRTLSGPTGEYVGAVAITPDGKSVVSGSTDGGVRVWDTATGKLRTVLTGHKSDVKRLSISRDGRLAASSGYDGIANLWDLSTNSLVASLRASGCLRSVAFSPDGKVLAAGTGARGGQDGGALELWDVATQKRRLTLPAHPGPVLALAYSPDGTKLASGCMWTESPGAPSVKVWDVTSDPPRMAFQIEQAHFAAFSPDSKLLATCHWGGAGAVRVWSVPSGEMKATLDARVESMDFSADGNTLALAGWDRTVKLWEFASGALRTVGVHLGKVNAVAFAPQSDLLASASYDGTVKLWHTGPALDAAGFAHEGEVRALGFAPDSKLLVVGSDRRTAVLDGTTGEQKATLPVSEVRAVSADANLLAARVPNDKRAKHVIWDVAAARERVVLPVGPPIDKGDYGTAFSPDGKTLVAWIWDAQAPDYSVSAWDLATSRLRFKFEGKNIYCAAFSPDGQMLATAEQFGRVTLWDATTGERRMSLHEYEGGTLDAKAVAFSNDGKLLAAANNQGTLRLWSVETGQLKASFKGHTNIVKSLAFSPDSKTLLSGSDDRTARLWDVVTGQELLALKGHASPVNVVAFAPDGKRVATASGAEVRLWLAATEPEATAFRSELDPDDPDSPRATNNWGDRLREIHRPQEAEIAYRKARARLENLADTLEGTPDYRLELAHCLIAVRLMTDSSPAAASSDRPFADIWRTLPADRQWQLSDRFLSEGRTLRDARRFQEALKVYQQLAELMPTEPMVWHHLGYTHDKSGEPEKAIAAYSRAIDLDPKDAVSWNNRGSKYHELRQLDKATTDYRQAIALEPNEPALHINLGNTLRAQGKPNDAITAYHEGLKALGPGHPKAQDIQSVLLETYRSQGNLPEAIAVLEQICDHELEKFGPTHASTLWSVNQLAVLFWQNKQLDRSVPILEETVRLMRAHLPPDDSKTYTSIANLGVNYRDAGRRREALPLLEEVVEWARKQPAPVANQFAWVTGALVETYEQGNELAKAEALHREELQRAQQQFGATDLRTAGPMAMLGLNLLRHRKYTEAEPLLRDCLAFREKAQPDVWTTFNAKSLLGGALLGQTKYAEAEPLLRQGYEGMKQREAKIPPLGKPRLREAVERLVQLYDEWGQPEKAAQWRKKLAQEEREMASLKKGSETKRKPLERTPTAAEEKPSDAGHWLRQANFRVQRGDWEGARQGLVEIIDLRPDDLALLGRIAGFYLRHGRGREAAAVYDRAIEKSPSNAALTTRREQLQPGVVAVWNFDAGPEDWGSPHHCTVWASAGILHIQMTGDDPWVIVPAAAPAGWKELTLHVRTNQECRAQLFWGTERTPVHVEERSVFFNVKPGNGEWTQVKVRFRADAALTSLRLDPVQPGGKVRWEIDAATLAHVDPPPK